MPDSTFKPVGLSGNTWSEVYVDGMPLTDLNVAYDYNQQASGSTKWSAPSRFWSSAQRPASDTTREVIEMSLTVARPTNRVQFQVSSFPCKVTVQYHDGTGWLDVMDRFTNRAASVQVTRSVPAVVNADVFDSTRVHPQHRGAGHWRTIEFTTKMFSARRLRLVLQRITTLSPPRSPSGQEVAYSLAVRDLQMGYRVDSPADVPNQGQRTQIADDAEPFTGSRDLLGSPVNFALRQYRLSDIYWPEAQMAAGLAQSQRFDENQIWKSEPQPYAYCVVPIYADVRGPDGTGQVLDTIEVDPTTSGVATNLYYSNTDIDWSANVEASDNEIHAPFLIADPQVLGSADALILNGTVTIAEQATQWDSSKPWWIGLSCHVEPGTTDASIFSGQGISIAWVAGALQVAVQGSTFTVDGASPDTLIYLSRDSGSRVNVRTSTGFHGTGQVAPAERSDDPLVFGGGDVVRLRAFVLKQQDPKATDAQAFFADPHPYVVKPGLNDAWEDITHNALLRIHPSFQSAANQNNPYGIQGGSGNFYDTVEWTPIMRDFLLHKGLLSFDAVKAKYFKIEFTNLVAQPFQASRPVRRKILLFPIAIRANALLRSQSGGDTGPLGGVGNVVNGSLASGYWFSDQSGVLARRTSPYESYLPTEAVYSSDPSTQDRLSSTNPLFGMLPWHQGQVAPRFTDIGVHRYLSTEVEQDSKVAYFVGLNSLRFLRSDYAATTNAESYLYHFHDDDGFDGDWALATDDTGLYTTAEGVISTSDVLRSVRNVRGVQFATTQTPPEQRLTNPDFNDDYFNGWAPYGSDIVLTMAEDVGTDIGSMVRVDRAGGTSGPDDNTPVGTITWDGVENQYPTWDDLEGLAWNLITGIESPSIGAEASGITSTEWIDLPERGRVYASARIYSPDALAGPLHIQIVGEDGQVLSDEKTVHNTGQIVEWYASYTIGDGGDPPAGRSWDAIEALGATPPPTWDEIEGLDTPTTWDDVSETTSEGFHGRVTVRVVQEGVEGDTWYVDSIALWDDPIIWDFSNDDGDTWYPAYDIRNNPHGVLLFPNVQGETLSPTDGTNLRWRVSGYRAGLHVNALLIRPWYSSLGKGLPSREGLEHGGANLTPYDQYPTVPDAPMFKQWSRPIPEYWWFGQRQWLLQRRFKGLPDLPIQRNLVPDPSGEGTFDGWTVVGGTITIGGTP